MYVFHLRMPYAAALVLAQVYEGDLRLNVPRSGRGRCRVDFFCRTRRDARARLRELKLVLNRQAHSAAGIRRLKPLPAGSWNTIWRKHFSARRVSGRIVVRPPWQKFAGGKNDCVIEIEPGMAFGTGLHATTRSCLEMMDEFSKKFPAVSFLDAGCGSGILAVAAARLGFRTVEAFDNDPLAVKTARKNIYVNKVARRVSCREADIENFRPGKSYALVAANLFANLLVRSAGRFADLLEPGQSSRLLVSGILKRQYASVKRVFAACGLREEKRKPRGGWVTAMYKRKEEGA